MDWKSSGMLQVARAKHPDVSTEKVGLQELTFASLFDAAICVDAMENVFPRTGRWLANLRRDAWVRGAGLQTVEDGHSEGDGYGYYHLMTQSQAEGELPTI